MNDMVIKRHCCDKYFLYSVATILASETMASIKLLRTALVLSASTLALASFGLTEDGDSFVVDTNAGLIFTG